MKQRLHYCPDTGVFTSKFTGKEIGHVTERGYRMITIKRKTWPATRVAVLYTTGELLSYPANIVDHIDGDPTNNVWTNLRVTTSTVNNRNARKRKDGSEYGVGIGKKSASSYYAYIYNQKKQINLGSYPTIEEARSARLGAEKVLGSFSDRHGMVA
ncbi:HNH endonuclease [Vibrio breoganii]